MDRGQLTDEWVDKDGQNDEWLDKDEQITDSDNDNFRSIVSDNNYSEIEESPVF